MWRAGLGFVVLLAAAVGVASAVDEPADIKDHPKLVWWKIQSPEAREAKAKCDDVVAKARKAYDDALQNLKAERDESLAQARRKLKDGLEEVEEAKRKLHERAREVLGNVSDSELDGQAADEPPESES